MEKKLCADYQNLGKDTRYLPCKFGTRCCLCDDKQEDQHPLSLNWASDLVINDPELEKLYKTKSREYFRNCPSLHWTAYVSAGAMSDELLLLSTKIAKQINKKERHHINSLQEKLIDQRIYMVGLSCQLHDHTHFQDGSVSIHMQP